MMWAIKKGPFSLLVNRTWDLFRRQSFGTWSAPHKSPRAPKGGLSGVWKEVGTEAVSFLYFSFLVLE